MSADPLASMLQRIDDLDTAAELARTTDAEVASLKAALGAMIDAKVAHFRDGDDERATRLSHEAGQHLAECAVPGVLLFGDLADGISGIRMAQLMVAMGRER